VRASGSRRLPDKSPRDFSGRVGFCMRGLAKWRNGPGLELTAEQADGQMRVDPMCFLDAAPLRWPCR
jgi:hypothetical protein